MTAVRRCAHHWVDALEWTDSAGLAWTEVECTRCGRLDRRRAGAEVRS